jgi:hypothetical protein
LFFDQFRAPRVTVDDGELWIVADVKQRCLTVHEVIYHGHIMTASQQLRDKDASNVSSPTGYYDFTHVFSTFTFVRIAT